MKKQMNRSKIILIVVIGIVAIVCFGLGIFFIERSINKEKNGGTSDQNVTGQILYFGDDEYEITHNIETYLFLGTDDSGNVEAENTKEYRGQMADFLLLLVIDRTENTYGLLNMNRDTMCNVPYMDTEGNGQGSAFEQLCIAHWYGGTPEMGCNNTVYTVSELLGDLEIDGYYSIHMSDIATLNHAVGGVEITLEEDLTDVDPAMKKGATITLTDEQAEAFVRARMGVGDGKNTSRMRRQEQFIKGFKTKAFSMMKSDPAFIDTLIDSLNDQAVTNIPKNRLSVIANQVYKAADMGIFEYEGLNTEGDTLGDGIVHAEFYADTESIAKVMSTLCGIDEAHITRYEETGEDE